jgi:predicted lipoprotein with Yx(FWY)xxD motif
MNVRKEIQVRRIRTLPTLVVVAFALVALVVAACGGGGDSVKAAAPAASSNMSAANGGTADLAVSSGSLGKTLVDSQGRTLYLFEKDTGTMSTCSGACATDWPPAPASAHPKAGSGVDAALVGRQQAADLWRTPRLPLCRRQCRGRHERPERERLRRRVVRRIAGGKEGRGRGEHDLERRRLWLLAALTT